VIPLSVRRITALALAVLVAPLVSPADPADARRHRPGPAYWLAAADGGVFTFGRAAFAGGAAEAGLRRPISGIADVPDGSGYWLVARDGGVFAFGNAPYLGGAAGLPLNRSVVGMASTPTGRGYWPVGSDGGVFAFGDAGFFGAASSAPLTRRSSASPPPPPAGATGWWAPTGACSPSATRSTTAGSRATA